MQNYDYLEQNNMAEMIDLVEQLRDNGEEPHFQKINYPELPQIMGKIK